MISKRMMLAGGLVVGISYALAIERGSLFNSDAHLTTSGEPKSSDEGFRMGRKSR